jgi:endo-1,4-beta-xylanase
VTGLNALAKAAGKKYFGTATDNPELKDSAYTKILNSSEFGQITPGNALKWSSIEGQRGALAYSQGDTVLAFATANKQLFRGHNLIWGKNQLPNWVKSPSQPWTKASLTSVIQTHINEEVTHYKGKAYAWDVVNEPFNDDGTWNQNVFYNTLGQDYVAIALKAAHAADPATKLYINDYNIDSVSGTKSLAMQKLVKSLKAQGVPIHGVGMESHYILGQTPSKQNLVENYNAYTALDIDIAITELDIRMTMPSTDSNLQKQATEYEAVVGACVAVKRCVGITVWDFTDKYSWVPSTFQGQGAACLYDSNLKKKPAYNGIVRGLGGASIVETGSKCKRSIKVNQRAVANVDTTESVQSEMALPDPDTSSLFDTLRGLAQTAEVELKDPTSGVVPQLFSDFSSLEATDPSEFDEVAKTKRHTTSHHIHHRRHSRSSRTPEIKRRTVANIDTSLSVQSENAFPDPESSSLFDTIRNLAQKVESQLQDPTDGVVPQLFSDFSSLEATDPSEFE